MSLGIKWHSLIKASRCGDIAHDFLYAVVLREYIRSCRHNCMTGIWCRHFQHGNFDSSLRLSGTLCCQSELYQFRVSAMLSLAIRAVSTFMSRWCS